MKLIKLLGFIVLSLASTLLDVSFFSALPFHEATIISTLSIIIILALLGNLKNEISFSFSAIIFFSLFSSVPVWYLVLTFMIIPTLVLYLRKSYLPDLSVLAATPFFIGLNLIFQLGLTLIVVGGWNNAAFNALGYFVLVNTVSGLLLYFLIKIIFARLEREKILF